MWSTDHGALLLASSALHSAASSSFLRLRSSSCSLSTASGPTADSTSHSTSHALAAPSAAPLGPIALWAAVASLVSKELLFRATARIGTQLNSHVPIAPHGVCREVEKGTGLPSQ